MTHTETPLPSTAELWARAADWLHTFAGIFGDALKIARRYRMTRADIVAAFGALAPVESLVRRLVFAAALAVKLKPRTHTTRIVRRVAVGAPSNMEIITLDPGAWRRRMLATGIVRLRPPHPLDGAPETWPARFCVARFAPVSGPSVFAPDTAQTGTRTAHPRPPVPARLTISRNRAARRARVSRAAAREAAYMAWMMGPYTPGERMPSFEPPPAPPRHDPYERLCTIALACRVEALGRVLANPARHARALARRLAKIFAPDAAQRFLRRAFNDEDGFANAHIRAALPPDTS